MTNSKLVSRRKALARISALAIGAYVAPTALTISTAHAKKGSSGGGSTGGGSTSGSSTSGSSTSGSSTSGSSTSGSKTLMEMFSKKKRKHK